MRRHHTAWRTIAGRASLAAAILALGLDAPLVAQAEAPRLLYSHLPPSEHSAPIWVAADELLGKGDGPDWQVLGAGYAQTWERAAGELNRLPSRASGVQEVGQEQCTVSTNSLTGWRSPVQPPDDGLLPLIKGERAGFVGTVVEQTPGFLFGVPVTLLTVEIDDAFHLEETVRPIAGHLYLAYPEAHFAVRGRVICGEHEKGAEPPEVGTKLVVMAQQGPLDQEGVLLKVHVEELIIVNRDDSLTLPPNLERDDRMRSIVSLGGLLDEIHRVYEAPLEAPTLSPRKEGPR